MKYHRIIIGSDIVPTESNISMFCAGNMEEVVGHELLTFLNDSSYVICNLETPLTDISDPILKCGPRFITPTRAINGLNALGVNLVSLANNHIKDQGTKGIISTCQTIESANMNFIGVGDSVQTACKPFSFEFSGKRIGVYSCVEHEFSSAKEADYGANAFDAISTLNHISSLRDRCDYLVVLYHGGKEYYRYPSPDLQKTCRSIVDRGADLVVCQHSHCIGSEEKYKNSTIVYGQGNFIFNKKNDEFWNSSLLIYIDENLKINYLPIVRTDYGTRMASEKEKEIILSEFIKRSDQIKSSVFIKEEYRKFSESLLNSYITALSGKKSVTWLTINRITKGKLAKRLLKTRYPKRQLAMLKNYIECEAHRELILEAIDTAMQE